MVGAHGMAHPAYADNYCEKHEVDHQEDICPLCWHEDHSETCEEHDIELIDGECEMCEAERKADMLHDMMKDGEA